MLQKYGFQSFIAATNETQVVRKMSHKEKTGVQHLSVLSKAGQVLQLLQLWVFSPPVSLIRLSLYLFCIYSSYGDYMIQGSHTPLCGEPC